MLPNLENDYLKNIRYGRDITLSIIIPMYNEEKTIVECIKNVLDIKSEEIKLEIILVDDCSTDDSLNVSRNLEQLHPEIKLIRHNKNSGKGSAIRTGLEVANGEFICIQDADLEYNPLELRKLLVPLANGVADVVLGSRFLSSGTHRVLYFWHYIGNKFLTLLSNMFTDLNLTDMETCYKIMKKDVIKKITIEENRFGFEPEIIAKIAQMRLRIFEMGISYFGRTYEEGKKIGFKDGLRALYCIFHYNAHKAPLIMQLAIYFFIGVLSAIFNLIIFLNLLRFDLSINFAAPIAFISAAGLNYFLSISLLFRHKAKWKSITEIFFYVLVVVSIAVIDLEAVKFFINLGIGIWASKILATTVGFFLNFLGRKYIVFPEKKLGPWKPQFLNNNK